ncbi:signal recognition particle-docking protein FtsY [Pediococcus acidilactici]|uniref:signal recognition particle-docking protein FtsY n=1 Tax=Pediococcus acidilactici TaxID=1254 RepID=UPI002FBECC24
MAWFFGKKKKKAKEAEKKVEPSTPVSQPEVEASPDKVKEVPTNTTPVKEPESKPEPTPAKEVSSAAPVNEEPQLNEAEKYDRGLERSRKSFGQKLSALFTNFSGVDDDFYDDLEETLIEADVGFDTALEISEEVREEIEFENVSDPEKISQLIVRRLVDLYTRNGSAEDNHLVFSKEGPTVFLFVGVNGVGKTTSIGKMAARFKARGRKVLLAACDTFRAGAIQQLEEWANRDGVDIVTGKEKSDPAAVAFEAVKKAKAENYDLVFIDTAGRLQNKVNLMKELDKIKRVISREIPDAPQESLLVLDSTTGQNALTQAKAFLETTNVTGIILTKLDGTAKGGIVLAIRNQLHLAVKYVGLGEKVEDLSPFNPEEYVRGLFKGLLDE